MNRSQTITKTHVREKNFLSHQRKEPKTSRTVKLLEIGAKLNPAMNFVRLAFAFGVKNESVLWENKYNLSLII